MRSGLGADAGRQHAPQARLPFGGTVAERRRRLALENLFVNAAKFRGGKALQRRTSQRQRDDGRVDTIPHQITQRGIGRAQRGRRDLATPREWDLVRLGGGAHKGAASHVPAQYAARFQLAIGVGGSGAAELQTVRQFPLGGQARAWRKSTLFDGRLQRIHKLVVEALAIGAVELELG